MTEWLEPMGLRGAIRVSNVPLYQELARSIGLRRMDEAVHRLGYGNELIGSDVTTFWLRGPLAISAVEQTRFLSRLAHQNLPFPKTAQQQVREQLGRASLQALGVLPRPGVLEGTTHK
ncbi:penicillin-binding transpeptidase domain-containing protein [Cyanobium sp. FGCU-52]|nr:penicillin-binding transpeptidase domain-containing protein [Cyanobium sp. FGCU52]